MREQYIRQVRLLVDILQDVAKEDDFALKGGTAINLFYRDMPRLSVDIDLIYLSAANRQAALESINKSLNVIGDRITARDPEIKIRIDPNPAHLRIVANRNNTNVKVEVSPVVRETIYEPKIERISSAAQQQFGFAEIKVVNFLDLFGGKIHAALDRQHPRDLFDIMVLFENEGLTDDLFRHLMIYIASSRKPIQDLLTPATEFDEKKFEQEFQGMTDRNVSKEELVAARDELYDSIYGKIDGTIRDFLLSLQAGQPDFSLIGLMEAENLPAVKWRLIRIGKTKARNSIEYDNQKDLLENFLESVMLGREDRTMDKTDPSISAIQCIDKILQGLDEQSRMLTLQWVAGKYSNLNHVADHGHSSQVMPKEISPEPSGIDATRAVDLHASNFPDFIYNTISQEIFDQLVGREKVLVMIKFFCSNSDAEIATTADLVALGEQTGHLKSNNVRAYLTFLKKDYSMIHSVEGGYRLTQIGEQRFASLVRGEIGSAPQKNKRKTSSSPKKAKKGKVRSNSMNSKKLSLKAKPDKDFIERIETHDPSFSGFLSTYDPSAYQSAQTFIVFAVYFICVVLNDKQANVEQISTCFAVAGKKITGDMTQWARNAQNRTGYILYRSPDDITLMPKGRKFIEELSNHEN